MNFTRGLPADHSPCSYCSRFSLDVCADFFAMRASAGHAVQSKPFHFMCGRNRHFHEFVISMYGVEINWLYQVVINRFYEL